MKEEILKFFSGEALDDQETLEKYSRDASVFHITPKIVLYPKDSEDIKKLVVWVSENKEKYSNLSITCRSAGTDMSGGAIGESIILDFTKYMNKLISFDSKKMQITAMPGMFYRDFEKITLEKGLILPCYTASKSLNTIGGMYGNNSAGERTLKYGKTENYILEAKVIMADGEERIIKPLDSKGLTGKLKQKDFEGKVYFEMNDLLTENMEEIKNARPKVHKNSAGYYLWNVINEGVFDLNKILVGSQGTLGIVTEITFRLVPEKKYSKLVAIFMKDLKPLGDLVDEILKHSPETLETYDDKTMKLAVRFFPDFLKNRGVWGMLKFMWSFLPEFKMMLTGGFPKMILLAEFSGEHEEDVHQKCSKLVDSIAHFKLKTHITSSEIEAEKYWDVRRESFSLLRKHVSGKKTAPFIDDIIVRPEFLPVFLPELNKLLSKYDLTYTIAGHAGDGNFHIIPLMDFKRADTAQIIFDLSDKVYDLVVKYEGSITAEHNDGIIRTPYLDKMFNAKILTLFYGVKAIFDPLNIFNPGKKVPIPNGVGTRGYIKEHILKE